MNRDPFEVLGLAYGADDSLVKEAYRSLARQYSADGQTPNAAKMREIDEAYDAIILSRTSGNTGGYAYANSFASFGDIRAKINAGKTDEADALLESVTVSQRTAEWYYLKGTVQHRRGWLEDAVNNYGRACAMEPDNAEYRRAYDVINKDRSGGYRTESNGGKGSSCSFCDICSGLLCADCCCECFGGDLIPCC